MKSFGERISDQKIVEKISISLPEKYDDLVAIIEEIKDLSTLSIQQLMGSLQSYEQRKLRHSNQSVDSVFQSKLTVKSQKFQTKAESSNGPRKEVPRRWKKHDSSRKREEKNEKGMAFNDSKPLCNICKKTIILLQIIGTSIF